MTLDADEMMRRVRTRSVQGGHGPSEGEVWPLVPPIVTSTVYASHDLDAIAARIAAGEPTYNRDQFPNPRLLGDLVAELEGAERGYAVASGMAAITVVVLTLLSQGDHLVVGAGGYSDTEELLTRELSRFGIAGTAVDLADLDAVRAAMTPRTRLVLAETIANPAITVTDIPAVAAIAHEHDAVLAIDNTFATPALCQPLALGADLVIHSATKFLGGHHDLSAGVVAGPERLMEEIARVGYLLGAVPGATDAWLAVRGIRTLAPRMDWISRSAREVATWLAARPEIARVRYPGVTDGEDRALVGRILPLGGGGVMVIELAGPEASVTAAALVRRLGMIVYAPSLGGEVTTLCYPPRIQTREERSRKDREACLRVSIGLEDPADIITDFEQAFARLP
jgi:cystathionine beta-lyase/cystathionine gamma-synthase